MPDRPETALDRCAVCDEDRGRPCPSEKFTECHGGLVDHFTPHRSRVVDLPGGGQAAIVDCGALARTESHADEAGATSAPPEASEAQGREEGPSPEARLAELEAMARQVVATAPAADIARGVLEGAAMGERDVEPAPEDHGAELECRKCGSRLIYSARVIGDGFCHACGHEASAAERAAREKAEARVATLTLEVARLQAAASAVHASALQARRVMGEVEERAANAALPWCRGGSR